MRQKVGDSNAHVLTTWDFLAELLEKSVHLLNQLPSYRS